mgnify:CR=1 FL=1
MKDPRITNNIRITKQQLKDLASEIRSVKPDLKNPAIKQWITQNKLFHLSYNYRHLHIAYCEVRGKTREQIESPGEDNFPYEKKIDEHKEAILNGDLTPVKEKAVA